MFEERTFSERKWGLKLSNLSESVTVELLYKAMQRLGINMKTVKASKVKTNKSGQCEGNAFYYFDAQESCQDAMKRIAGFELHGNRINSSIIVEKKYLTLFNDRNICIQKLHPHVNDQDIIQAFDQLGAAIISYRIQPNHHTLRNDAFVMFENSQKAEEILKLERVPSLSAHKIEPLKSNERSTKIGAYSTNIKIEFSQPLDQLEPYVYESALKEKINKEYGCQVASVFIWGKNARHARPTASRLPELQSAEVLERSSLVCPHEQNHPAAISEKPVDPGMFDCHLNPNTDCYKLRNAKSKAFVTFLDKTLASKFVEEFYGSVREGRSNTLKVNDEISVTMMSAIPQTKNPKDQKIIQNNLAKFDSFNKQYLYIGNLASDKGEQEIRDLIEGASKSKVISVQINEKKSVRKAIRADPNSAAPGAAPAAPEAEESYYYATVQIEDAEKAVSLVQDFKSNPATRNNFTSLFNGKKRYINHLKPSKTQKLDNLRKKKDIQQRQRNFPQSQPFPFPPGMINFPAYPFPLNFPTFPVRQQRPFVSNQNNQMRDRQRQNHSAGHHSQRQFNNNNNNNPTNRTQSTNPNQNRGYNNQNNQNKPQVQNKDPKVQKNEKKEKVVSAPQAPAPAKAAPSKQPALAKLPPIEELIKKSTADQKQILSAFLIGKVKAILTEKQNVALLSQVIVIITDFDLFRVEEIYEFSQKEEDLKEVVQEAIDTINEESTAQ